MIQQFMESSLHKFWWLIEFASRTVMKTSQRWIFSYLADPPLCFENKLTQQTIRDDPQSLDQLIRNFDPDELIAVNVTTLISNFLFRGQKMYVRAHYRRSDVKSVVFVIGAEWSVHLVTFLCPPTNSL